MTLYLLDTNMVTYLVSGSSQAARRAYLAAAPHAEIRISVMTEAEMRFGFEKKQQSAKRQAALLEFVTQNSAIPWTSDSARAYGKLRATLQSTGRTIATMDLLIAAHAIAAKATLVTHDKALLNLHPIVNVTDWATDL